MSEELRNYFYARNGRYPTEREVEEIIERETGGDTLKRASMETIRLANEVLFEYLRNDVLNAASAGRLDVSLGSWPDGWKAAVVMQGDNEPVMRVGPRRRIEVEATEARVHVRVVTEDKEGQHARKEA